MLDDGLPRTPTIQEHQVQLRNFRATQIVSALASISTLFLSVNLAMGCLDEPTASERALSNHAVSEAKNNASKSVIDRFKIIPEDETPDFQKHVAPLLGRLGCNGRACHGSFQGQGGFQLSLFGYDFKADHEALLADDRVNLEVPAESLVLTKPTDEDNHEGGLRYEKGSWQFNLLSAWINNGAKTPEKIHQLDRLVVEPSDIQILDPEQSIELKAIAHWADGTIEDVTPLCRFHSNDDSIAIISEEGDVSTKSTPGDTHVVVSYDNAVVPVPVIHPIAKRSSDLAVKFKTPTRVDQLVAQKWAKLGVEPSPLSDDSMFLRRVSLDITGTLPTSAEIREFLASQDPDKRKKKIDQLLESPAYVAWWTTFFCDMTENNTSQLRNISYDNNSASNQWYNWIHQRVEKNVPYDDMIEGIVTGINRQPGERYIDYCDRMTQLNRQASDYANTDSMPYYWMRREFQTRDTRAISFAHAFLGLRIQCAQCHKHPFDQWSQDDFKQFSKFFSGVSLQSTNGGRTQEDKDDFAKILENLDIDPKDKNRGNLRKKLSAAMKQGETTPYGFLAVHEPKPTREELKEYSNKVKASKKQKKKKGEKPQRIPKPTVKDARLLGAETVELADYEDVRVPVMEWMRRPDNPFFATALVNRVWKNYFGVGIVDPADDLNMANPPSNAALLDYLATEFIKQDFDLKWLHREIANSRTYQLSWVTNETNVNDRRNFSRALPRRLPAEVIFDAITFAASNPEANSEFRNDVEGRAISIPGTVTNYGNKKKGATDSAFALRVFGRSERASSCDCDRSDETSLIQTVYMQNDRDIHLMLTRKNSWLNQLAAKHQTNSVADTEKRQLASQEKRISSMKKNHQKLVAAGNDRQAQKMQNQIDKAIRKTQPIRDKIAAAEKQKVELNLREFVTEAYLRTLSRLPSETELTRCEAHIRGDKDLINGVTGVMWALVNTKEFIVNH